MSVVVLITQNYRDSVSAHLSQTSHTFELRPPTCEQHMLNLTPLQEILIITLLLTASYVGCTVH